jgi:virulence-associated protein VagC
VRLPKEYRFPDSQREVSVYQEGRRIVLEPVEEWSQEFLACLGSWREEIPRPPQAPETDLEDPFA